MQFFKTYHLEARWGGLSLHFETSNIFLDEYKNKISKHDNIKRKKKIQKRRI
jgi:hypothetical protein